MAGVLRTTAHRRSVAHAKEIDDIPGCNAIYLRDALKKVMPVEESLLTAEDVWMNFCIRRAGYKLILAPDVILWHYRRSSIKKFLRQVYRFAIGRVQIAKRSRSLINLFHIITGVSIPVLLLSGVLLFILNALTIYIGLILIVFIAMIILGFIKTRQLSVSFNLPLVMILFITAWSSGFLKELFFPLKEIKGK